MRACASSTLGSAVLQLTPDIAKLCVDLLSIVVSRYNCGFHGTCCIILDKHDPVVLYYCQMYAAKYYITLLHRREVNRR